LLTLKYIKNVRVQARGSILKAQDRAGDECLRDTDECIKIPQFEAVLPTPPNPSHF